MVLDWSKSNAKRKSLDQGKGPKSKKNKSNEEEDLFVGSSLFSEVCKTAGVLLNKYNKLGIEQAVFQRNVLKDLRGRGGQEEVLAEIQRWIY